MGTHQELEMFGNQPAYPEKLLHKKESLQNQLINIRVELSQATTVTPPAPTSHPLVWPSALGRECHPSRVVLFRFPLNTVARST